ncbi:MULTISPECIES: cation diffusion facilitator family transporter [Aphanothece]|uniref:cation diffusion facilitator family transporter n=1 Tax=Aphanothece TaxID=1121 RepID=UPI00398EE73A
MVPHHHGSSHPGSSHPSSAPFRWSVLLNTALVVVQLVIGFSFGSLALIGDALHNLGDVAGLGLGWAAERLALRPASRRFTYGYRRSTQFAALANAALVLMAGGVVMVEAIQRLGRPVLIQPAPVAWAALAGLAINLLSARLFGHGHLHDLNRRAAVMHLLTDAAVSAAVLAGALLILLTGWSGIDPLVAIGVGVVVAWSGWQLLLEAGALMLDAVPRGVDLAAIETALLSLEGVVGLHHLHVWSMSTATVALTVHLQCDPARPQDQDDAVLREARGRLRALGVQHATLQLERALDSCR